MFGLFGYTQTAYIRYGPDDAEYRRAVELRSNGDIIGLNGMLLGSKSLSNKLIMMSFLKEFSHDSSISSLVQTLAFDLPWWDRFDGHLEWKSDDVRFSAHSVLAEFGSERAGDVVYSLLEEKNHFKRLYGAGVVMRWGGPLGERILDEYIKSGSRRLSDEAGWVKREAIRYRQSRPGK